MNTSTKSFILITGDDSVRSEGAILIKRVVEKFADYQIIATKHQASAIGAAIKLDGDIGWGFEEVDGHKAIWVDAYPSDAINFAKCYLERKPDLVISGLNTGLNVQNQVLPKSGTVAAAQAASVWYGVPAVSMSIDVGDNLQWMKAHNGTLREEWLDYPGKMIELIVKKALNNQFPKYTFWNVNFPEAKTDKLKITRIDEGVAYSNLTEIGEGKFSYIFDQRNETDDKGSDFDVVLKGYVSISPCKVNYYDESEHQKLTRHFNDTDNLCETP